MLLIRRAPSSAETETRRWLVSASEWLRRSRLGLATTAVAVGVGAGFGAVGFRWLIYAFTWLVTGHVEFGQQGRVGSTHLPWLGPWFLLVVPVVGGLLYGPLIQRFAPEARGHGVPEVMSAVAENGGRIRPQVTVVKALASALCIGTGGSVGREGPIVQIGSALASSLGQLVRMPEARLRLLVACGAAGGIAATFNAPITGLLFGFELILRDFSIDALVALILAAATADVISQAFFGSAPFFAHIPHDLVIAHDSSYLLVAVLGLAAGAIGVGFKNLLYKVEDLCDGAWKERPDWAKPVIGGVALGAVLLAVPQMYGVGYPVVTQAITGHEVLWFVGILMVVKMFAASLTIGIGGSGGVFAPSLFIGAMAGTAFGDVARDVFGPAVGSPATYGVIAMGAVFAAAAQAPLTSIATALEMTGNLGLALPVMLAVGIATGVSRRLTKGTIYTTKLLRRGIDVDAAPGPGAVDLMVGRSAGSADHIRMDEESNVSVREEGSFEVTSWSEVEVGALDGTVRVTRTTIGQRFLGGFEGESIADMVMTYRDDGTADFVGYQRVKGRIGDRSGTFVLQCVGEYDGTDARTRFEVVAGSAREGLAGLRGTGNALAPPGSKGTFSFDFEL